MPTLLDIPAEDRIASLRREADPSATLAGLAEMVKQLVLTDLPRAEVMSAALRELADAVGDAASRARVLAACSHVAAYGNRFAESLALAESAARLAESADAGFEWAAATIASVQPLARLGRFDEARAAAIRAGDRFESLGEPVWSAKARVNAGVIARMQDRPDEALDHLRRARPAFAGHPATLGQIDSNIAEALLDSNRFGEAESAFVSAIAALDACDATRAAVIAEGNLADLLGRQGRSAEALARFERALRRIGPDGAAGDRARLETERAEVLAAIGLFDDARASCERALPALDAAGLAWESARTRLALGRILAALGRDADAGAFVRDAEQRFAALQHATGQWRAWAALASLRPEARGDEDLTARLVAGLAGTASRPLEGAIGRLGLATLLLESGAADAAEAALDDALTLAAGTGVRPLEAEVLHARGRARRARGRAAEARDDFRSAVAIVDGLRGVLPLDRLRAATQGAYAPLFDDAISAALDAADGAADQTGDGASLAEAFKISEQSRARALQELVEAAARRDETKDAPRDGDEALVRELESWHAELNALYSRQGSAPAAAAARDLGLITRAREAEQRIGELEARLGAGRFALAFRAVAGADEVTGSIPADGAMVSYVIAGGQVVAFVLRPGGRPAAIRVAAVEEVRRQADAWRLQVGRARARPGDAAQARLIPAADESLRALHGSLLAPISSLIDGARRLVICPAGPLVGVPFHALHDGSRYVVEDRVTTVSPSATVHARLPGPPERSACRLVVGVADDAAPGIADEAAATAAAMPGAVRLDGPDATADGVIHAASHAGILHLACHATATPGDPFSARLRLSDRWLTARDVSRLRLPRSIVLLTGCETGGGELLAGDELFGLTRAFLAAGASSIVATLWPVHDGSATGFVLSLYRAWSRSGFGGAALSDALAGAAREAIAVGWHPVRWAPFFRIGQA